MDNMIGMRIRKKRKSLNLSPSKIKELTGIGTGHLSELETGKKLPSTPTLIKLSEVFNCSIDWILFGKTSNCEFNISELSALDCELISDFHKLNTDQQEEILDIISVKIKRMENGKKSLNSSQGNNITSA